MFITKLPISQVLTSPIGSIITTRGWVTTIRDQKHICFLLLKDRGGTVQVVCDKRSPTIDGQRLKSITPQSTIVVTGEVRPFQSADGSSVELLASSIEILSLAATPLPIQPSSKEEITMDWRYLALREDRARAIFEISTAFEAALRQQWLADDFIELHSPKLMAAASEGGAELFRLDYFDLGKASLAQSPQFYKQMAICAGFEKVFEIGPVFRANPSFTSRHDTEFTSIDVEIAWIDSVEDIMQYEELLLHHAFTQVAARCQQQLMEHFGITILAPSLPFPRLTMADAQALLIRSGFTPKDPADLEPEAERRLSALIKEQYDHDFVFVTDYPAATRPFYTMRDAGGELSTGYDLLYRGVEITSGAQREHRYHQLAAEISARQLDVHSLATYLDFFKYGVPPHGGFGLGLTRLIMKLLGLASVRDATFLYRGPHRLTP